MNEGTIPNPRDSQTCERGQLLFAFRPENFFSLVILWTLVCVIIIGAMWAFLRELGSDPEVWMFITGLVLFPLLVFLLYVSYINVFDSILIFEKGLIPPLGSEEFLNGLIMRRTYISFGAIKSFHIMERSYGRVIVAYGRLWSIPLIWDMRVLVPIIKTGIRDRHIMPPPR